MDIKNIQNNDGKDILKYQNVKNNDELIAYRTRRKLKHCHI